jgi:hypothetical protein
MGPAHGQAPPEAAQGVQMAQNTQVLSLTYTSSDLFGSMADETENQPRGEEDGITRTGPQGDQDRVEVAQMKVQIDLMMTTIRALSTAQGARGMGPAHGQAPPEAAQGVQMAQNTQVLSLTHTSSDLFGSMADETSSDLFGIMADKTENQVPNMPNLVSRKQFRRTEADRARMAASAAQRARSNPAWKVGGPAWSGWGSSRGR